MTLSETIPNNVCADCGNPGNFVILFVLGKIELINNFKILVLVK